MTSMIANYWWNGPENRDLTNSSSMNIILSQEEQIQASNENRLNECVYQRVMAMTMILPEVESNWLATVSSRSQLISRTAWGLRLLSKTIRSRDRVGRASRSNILRRKLVKRIRRPSNYLSQEEKDEAFRFWIIMEQKRFFALELNELKAGKPCPKKSPLSKLNPVLDEHGVLHLGGRQENSG